MTNRKVYYFNEDLSFAGFGESAEVPPGATTIAPPEDCGGKLKFNPETNSWECIPFTNETNLQQ